jgi:hypothetical protein
MGHSDLQYRFAMAVRQITFSDFVWKTSKFTLYLYSELGKIPTLVAYRTTVAMFCDLSISFHTKTVN